jgi:hypothetical protein
VLLPVLLLPALLFAAVDGAYAKDAGVAKPDAAVASRKADAAPAEALKARDGGVLIKGLAGATRKAGTSKPDGGADSDAQAGAGKKLPQKAAAAKAKKPLPSWVPKLSATVKPAVVKVGDPIVVTIKTRYKKGINVTVPLKLELGEFSELSRRDWLGDKPGRKAKTIKGDVILHTFELTVAAYKLGKLDLPAIDVNALGPNGQLFTLRTPAIPIQIRSVMVNEPKPKLKEVEPPVQVFQRTYWLLYLLIGLALAGVIATTSILLYRRAQSRRRAAAPPPPPEPPEIVALRRLAALDVVGMIENEQFKELYLELSELLREYVGGRYRFDALEMTTTEIIEWLEMSRVSSELREELRAYFNDCDLVKFAKVRPEADEAQAHVDRARDIIESTTPVARPEPAKPTAGTPQKEQDGVALS